MKPTNPFLFNVFEYFLKVTVQNFNEFHLFWYEILHLNFPRRCILPLSRVIYP